MVKLDWKSKHSILLIVLIVLAMGSFFIGPTGLFVSSGTIEENNLLTSPWVDTADYRLEGSDGQINVRLFGDVEPAGSRGTAGFLITPDSDVCRDDDTTFDIVGISFFGDDIGPRTYNGLMFSLPAESQFAYCAYIEIRESNGQTVRLIDAGNSRTFTT